MAEDGTAFTPGLHLVRDDDPARRAAEIARSLGVTVRSSPQAVTELLASITPGRVTEEDLDRIEALARRLVRLSAVEHRTLDRAASDVSDRLASAAGALAIHPDTVRERAAAVEAARADLVEAERELAAQAARDEDAAEPGAEGTEEPAPPSAPSEPAVRPERSGPSPRIRQSRAIGTVVGAFGLGLVLLGTGVLPLWAALIPTLAASLWASWYLRDRGEAPGDAGQQLVTDRLAELGATPSVAAPPRGGLTGQARRDAAQEQLRVAERAWHELAGSDADVSEVEAVVQRFDAQHGDSRALATVTAPVRAAAAVRRHVEEEWASEWRAMGKEPPAADEAVVAVATLRTRLARPVVLEGASEEQARQLSTALFRVPVVLVEGPDGPASGPRSS